MASEIDRLRSALRPFVNDPQKWQAFKDFIAYEINAMGRSLEKQSDPVSIYRAQGELRRLRKLEELREFVNGK